MTDQTERATAELETAGVPTNTQADGLSAAGVIDPPGQRDYEQIRDVVARYTGQLLHGCGSRDCTEALCNSGYRNTTLRPVRRYTPRSARALALVLVSGTRPRARLCTKYEHSSQHVHPAAPEGPRDPSAFIQRLADTASVRDWAKAPAIASRANAAHWSGEFLPDEKFSDCDFEFWHALLRDIPISNPGDNGGSIEATLESSRERSVPVIRTLEWIINRLPKCTNEAWVQANDIISAGYVCPPRVQCTGMPSRALLAVLDALEDRQALRLFCRCLEILDACQNADMITLDASIVMESSLPFALHYTGPPKLMTAAERIWHGMMSKMTDWHELLPMTILLKKVFLRNWNNEVRASRGTLAFISLSVLEKIYMEAWKSSYTPTNYDLQDAFCMPVVAQNIDVVELAQSRLTRPRKGHLLGYYFLFRPEHDATYFRTINHLRMRQASSDAELASLLRSRLAVGQSSQTVAQDQLAYLEERYLLLDVSRDNVLRDTFDQLWQRRESELLRPLRVRLGEMQGFEIGHDLGGVQIEFFNLVWRAILSEEAQMFTTDSTTGYNYFMPGSLQPLYMFELCGLLFALALHNGINIPVTFPIGFYQHLSGQLKYNLSPIRKQHPMIARAMDMVLKEDIPDLQSTFSLEANGLRLTIPTNVPLVQLASSRYKLNVIDASPIKHHMDPRAGSEDVAGVQQPPPRGSQPDLIDLESISDAWPGWHIEQWFYEPKEVTHLNKQLYARQYVNWLLVLSVQPQWDAFQKGFARIYDDIDLVQTQYTMRITEGSSHFDINELKRVTTYEGYDPNCRYIRSFWRIVTKWPKEKQMLLVKFVTARERVPGEGAAGLKFQINRASHMSLDHLPTSSTCFGTLTLPLYPSTRILEEKLNLALKYGPEGFGSG